MWSSAINHLTRNDYASALQLLARVEAQAGALDSFARAGTGAERLRGLRVDDAPGLRSADRPSPGVGLPGVRLGANEIACVDRHFFEHPLVRHHGIEGGLLTRRIFDLVSRPDFQRSALYADY